MASFVQPVSGPSSSINPLIVNEGYRQPLPDDNWRKIKYWSTEQEIQVGLYRKGDEFMVQIVDKDGKKTRKVLDIGGKNPNIFYAEMHQKTPYFVDGKFKLCSVHNGIFDQSQKISELFWGVTLICSRITAQSLGSGIGSLFAIPGHASIAVEHVSKDGIRRMTVFDLIQHQQREGEVSTNETPLGQIDSENSPINPERIKTPTFIRPAAIVEKMVERIRQQVTDTAQNYPTGNPRMYYSMIGVENDRNSYNCLSWAEETLNAIGVVIPPMFDGKIYIPRMIGSMDEMCKRALITGTDPEKAMEKLPEGLKEKKGGDSIEFALEKNNCALFLRDAKGPVKEISNSLLNIEKTMENIEILMFQSKLLTLKVAMYAAKEEILREKCEVLKNPLNIFNLGSINENYEAILKIESMISEIEEGIKEGTAHSKKAYGEARKTQKNSLEDLEEAFKAHSTRRELQKEKKELLKKKKRAAEERFVDQFVKSVNYNAK